jgi:hypothetical protein
MVVHLNKSNVVDVALFNHHTIKDVEVIIYTLQTLPPGETDSFSASTMAPPG